MAINPFSTGWTHGGPNPNLPQQSYYGKEAEGAIDNNSYKNQDSQMTGNANQGFKYQWEGEQQRQSQNYQSQTEDRSDSDDDDEEGSESSYTEDGEESIDSSATSSLTNYTPTEEIKGFFKNQYNPNDGGSNS
jgi:hypothetical protein